MDTQEELKEIVRKKYSEIALQDKKAETGCCGSECCGTEVYNIMTEDYSNLEGYQPDADLNLGCGLPTKFARIRKGDTVIDLGSGAGNDCFIARSETGETGKVIGIDFTPAMIEKARMNAEKLSFHNVEFRQGDIENMPLASGIADVIVSNCVLNLVPDKNKVFKEIYRVLKPGAHFSISDIVLIGELPDAVSREAEMYAGCVAGALQKDTYLELILSAGFKNVVIQKQRPITVPEDILKRYLDETEIARFNSGDVGIFSITVYGEKASEQEKACCQPVCCN
jgi:SAM-dependent methyltransferase